VVLAGELLKKAEELLDQDIHATIIASGYRKAAAKAQEVLQKIARSISPDDVDMLKKIVATSLSSKGSEIKGDKLVGLIVEAAKQIVKVENGKIKADRDKIKLEKKIGGSSSDSQLVRGIVLDKEVVHPGMPKRVRNAKIALISSALRGGEDRDGRQDQHHRSGAAEELPG